MNEEGHSITKLHGHSVGSFSGKAAFVAANQSRYILADDAKGVALQGERGTLAASLTIGKEVPKVNECEARTFYTTCLKERGDILGAELRKERSHFRRG